MTSPIFLNFDECLRIDSGYLVTVNLQHLYVSRQNADFRRALFGNKCAHLCLDGRGAQAVFERWLGRKLPHAVGNEILQAWLNRAKGSRVLVIGTEERVIAKIRRIYPNIEFSHDASRIPQLDTQQAAVIASDIVARFGTGYSAVAIALGVPKQEMLASALTRLLPTVPILCIGGSFEMLSGHYRRAPSLAQYLGLEGVWRLLFQPNRDRFLRLIRSYWHFFRFIANPRQLKDLAAGKEKDQ